MTRRRRSLNVLAIVDAVRETHPELQRRLTIAGIRRVLEREGIDVLRRPIPNLAYVQGGLGSYIIMLRAGLSPRIEARVLAHEYAHIKLHFTDDHEVVFQQSPCRKGDPRELEAQLFGRLLELGPEASADHARIAPLIAALETGELLRARPAQIDLELPEPAPVYQSPPKPRRSAVSARLERAYEDSLAYGEQKRRRRGLPPVQHREVPNPRRYIDDFERVGYDDSMRAPWFRDVADRRWWIFNLAKAAPGSTEKWERLLDSMSPRISHRLFLSAAGERRVYQFRDSRESRAHRVKHLDRQITEATSLKRRNASLLLEQLRGRARLLS